MLWTALWSLVKHSADCESAPHPLVEHRLAVVVVDECEYDNSCVCDPISHNDHNNLQSTHWWTTVVVIAATAVTATAVVVDLVDLVVVVVLVVDNAICHLCHWTCSCA